MESLAPNPREQRVAMLPSIVRMLLTTFLEEMGRSDQQAALGWARTEEHELIV